MDLLLLCGKPELTSASVSAFSGAKLKQSQLTLKVDVAACRVNPTTGVSTATYTLDYQGWTLQPALNVKKRAPAVAVSKKLPQGRGTLKGTYALQDGSATLNWARKPASVRSLLLGGSGAWAWA